MSNNFEPIGNLVTPNDLFLVPNTSVMSRIISDTINAKFSDGQPNLWTAGMGAANVTSIAGALLNDKYMVEDYKSLPLKLFSSALPVGSDTGVLRNLATRMNTSLDCALIDQSEFPKDCKGLHPFRRNFTNIDDDSDPARFHDLYRPRYEGRMCAPGDILTSPWDYSSTSRQDISEELWIDFQFSNMSDFALYNDYPTQLADRKNFTQRCTSNTTLGYHELPNLWNRHHGGPLLQAIPDIDDAFNSANQTYFNAKAVKRATKSRYKPYQHHVPGPLLTATLAIFGPHTFFDLIATTNRTKGKTEYTALSPIVCSYLRYPFSALSSYGDNHAMPKDLEVAYGLGLDWHVPAELRCSERERWRNSPNALQALMTFLPNFDRPQNTFAAFTLTAYAVHKHLLGNAWGDNGLRDLGTSNGTTYQKPAMPHAAIVIISLLLLIQIISLGFLAIYAAMTPVWTETLDAKAMVRVGAEIVRQRRDMDPDMTANLGLGTAKKDMAPLLDRLDGWIGAEEGRNDGDVSEDVAAYLGDSVLYTDGELVRNVEKFKRRQRLMLGGGKAVRKGRVF